MSSLIFNANDAFEMAKRIEQKGQAFYTQAASFMPDPESAKLMIDLAEMELAHEKLFAYMQKSLSGTEVEDTLYDPHDDAYKFLKDMADMYVFDPHDAPANVFKPGITPGGILDIAIQREKDSIIFYQGIKVMVPEKFGCGRLDDIIGEEMRHVIMLSRQKGML